MYYTPLIYSLDHPLLDLSDFLGLQGCPYNSLCHDYNNGIPSTVAYMKCLKEYTEECLHEQEEWKVDEQAEICRNYNIVYSKCDDLAIPQSWGAINEPGHGLPHTIEESHPLGPRHKQCHYRNTCPPQHHISQPCLSLVPHPPPVLDDNITPDIPPSPTTCSDKHYSNNNTQAPTLCQHLHYT